MTTMNAATRPPRPVTGVDIYVTGRRIVATVLDGTIVGAVYGAMSATVGTVRLDGSPWHWTGTVPPGGGLAYGLLVGVYFVVFEAYLGRTMGKMVTGIKVVGETTGQAPGLPAALIRTVLRLVDGIFGYLVAFVVVLCSPRRQRLGDMAAHTLVVRA